jgi:hypothetical protein
MKSMGATRSAQMLCAISLLFSPVIATSSAQADSSSQVTPAPDAYKAALDQYRIELDLFMNTMKTRNQQIRSINLLFKNSCDLALSEFKIAMVQARTPDQKNGAIAARKSAISAAVVARDLAIAGLGAEPVPPVEPAKPQRAQGKNKSR